MTQVQETQLYGRFPCSDSHIELAQIPLRQCRVTLVDAHYDSLVLFPLGLSTLGINPKSGDRRGLRRVGGCTPFPCCPKLPWMRFRATTVCSGAIMAERADPTTE